MGFLLGDADFLQHIENSFCFHFKLSGQIIDSNFHPLCISSKCPLRDHN
jgi:hypothetical protein